MGKRISWLATWLYLCLVAIPVSAQDTIPDFEGMWSDPPVTAVDFFCSAACTDAGVERLNALLDDPANDDRPYAELAAAAADFQVNQYLRPRLTDAVLETFPLDPAEDPGFLYCQPWGVARQAIARHQLEIHSEGRRLEMRYGEWAASRTVYMDGREPPEDLMPTPMGFSVGRYESDALVIETTAISANLVRQPAMFPHSDQLHMVERYTISEDRQRLFLTVRYDDAWALKQPLVLKKVWGWAPDQEIFPVECERPTEFRRRGDLP